MSERRLGERALSYLRERGWHCFSEVELIWGATTDIVAIRKNRILIIELKRVVDASLAKQMFSKYLGISKHRGVTVLGVIGRQCNSKYNAQMPTKLMAMCEDGRLLASQFDYDTKSYSWIELSDFQRPLRETWPGRLDYWYGPGVAADKRLLCIFNGLPQTQGAGSPTGSKTIGLWRLAYNWGKYQSQKVINLDYKEAAHLGRMWLPSLPDSYGRTILAGAQGRPIRELEINP